MTDKLPSLFELTCDLLYEFAGRAADNVLASRAMLARRVLNGTLRVELDLSAGPDNARGYDMLVELRADRVNLQGEIERLTHELAEAQGTLVNRAAHDRSDVWAQAKVWLDVAGKPTDVEALAQRLARVEDRLPTVEGALRGQMQRLEKAATDARLDQVCEIIGARIGGLEERLGAVHDRISQLSYATRAASLTGAEPAFPTGAATTVEEVIAQVEEPGAESDDGPPRRGDRVRLEGAVSVGGFRVADGWIDVVGSRADAFQVASRRPTGGADLYFISNATLSLKEVRRGAAKLPE